MSNKAPADQVSSAEIERRRHVEAAIANNRIEGIPPSSGSLEICAAYIRGEIEAHDLVTVYKKRLDEAKEPRGH